MVTMGHNRKVDAKSWLWSPEKVLAEQTRPQELNHNLAAAMQSLQINQRCKSARNDRENPLPVRATRSPSRPLTLTDSDECDDVNVSDEEVDLSDPKEGDFLLITLKLKKSTKNYVGKVEEVKDDCYSMMYLRKCPSSARRFTFPPQLMWTPSQTSRFC